MKQDNTDKKNKAGSPIFIMIIFIALIGVIFYLPDIYEKLKPEVAEFLGIGSGNQNKPTTKPDDGKSPQSDFYQIGSNGELVYNEIKLTNISLQDGKLNFNLTTENTLELDKLCYYIEFYENRQTFIGRRLLSGTVTKEGSFSIDVSKLNITTTTYFTVSHIDDAGIKTPEDVETDESGISALNCTKDNTNYNYVFNLNKLVKTTYKYTYTNSNLEEFASVLQEFTKKEKMYNDFTGITASIVPTSSTFIFTSDFDFTTVKEYERINEENIFKKDDTLGVVKFKMDAKGYDCE